VVTESKRLFTDLEERRHAGIRYYAGGAGPPLLLVHGFGGWAGNWLAIAPELVRERRVIVAELPGHGGSDSVRGTRTLDPFVERLLAVLAAEDALPVAWFGHSFGGLVGVRAAATRPDAVSALVLAAAPGITSSTRVAEAIVTVLGTLRPARLAGWRSEQIARSPRGRMALFGGWGVADPVGLDPVVAKAFLDGAPQHTDTITAGRALVGYDPRTDLGRIRCRSLLLWGTNDNWVPLADGMEYARRLRAPLRTIADCGHLLIGERPDAVIAAVRDFLPVSSALVTGTC
jgi:pimeloyl-ACP methyl ester carboxylesterase